MTSCDAQQECVGVAQINRECYTCNNQTNDGDLVPKDLQSRYLLWREHIFEIPGMVNTCLTVMNIHTFSSNLKFWLLIRNYDF